MDGLLTATLGSELPAAGAPEWVHLIPSGHVQTRLGPPFRMDNPDTVLQMFAERGIDLPIDYEHQYDKPEAKLKGPVPAAGWIKELQARPNGIWGRVLWTATASEMIAAKEYRFLSPTILYHPQTREIVGIKGACLVHKPNLFLTALASEETAMLPQKTTDTPEVKNDANGKGLIAKIASLLKMPEGSAENDILQALAEKLAAAPDPAKFVPIDAVQDMMRDRASKMATMSETDVRSKVDLAVREGYITNGMRDWATALCSADPDSFDKFLSGVGPTFSYLQKPHPAFDNHPAARPSVAMQSESEAEELLCKQLGLKSGSLSAR
jgi:phage I-like protein